MRCADLLYADSTWLDERRKARLLRPFVRFMRQRGQMDRDSRTRQPYSVTNQVKQRLIRIVIESLTPSQRVFILKMVYIYIFIF